MTDLSTPQLKPFNLGTRAGDYSNNLIFEYLTSIQMLRMNFEYFTSIQMLRINFEYLRYSNSIWILDKFELYSINNLATEVFEYRKIRQIVPGLLGTLKFGRYIVFTT